MPTPHAHVFRQWKRDGLIHPIPLHDAVKRIFSHGDGLNKQRSMIEIEAALTRGELLQTKTAMFSINRDELE